jgi:hypothetical protein
MEFITRMMNDQSTRQRFKASEERRAYCEEEWIRTQEDADSEPDKPAPEPDPVPEVDPDPEPDDEGAETGDADEDGEDKAE